MVETHPPLKRTGEVATDDLHDPVAQIEVHLWTVDLDHSNLRTGEIGSSLSVDELERANRFRFDLHRKRFVRCRASLRRILSEWLHCNAREIEFQYGPNGKPKVEGLHFNVAHSSGLALIAISQASEIGVDLEAVRWLEDFDELVARFFCLREAQVFARLPDELKPAAFFNLWTRKEAILKSTGEGIAYSLNRVDVTFLPDEPPCVLSMPQPNWSEWTLNAFTPAPGYAAALALQNNSSKVKILSHEFH